jgi:hypothetical protein
MYVAIVTPPIDESFDKSFKSDTPLIREASISGTAINLSELINIVPKGLIQLITNSFSPTKIQKKITQKLHPRTIPNIICQCNAIFS